MSRWFRFYDDSINDPKVLRMPEALRWHWVAMLCVASKNDGKIPCIEDVALSLRVTERRAGEIVEDLAARGLLDEIEIGVYAPHNWNGRQYKSDVSTERVQRFRERQGNVSETPPETEADTENRKKKDISGGRKATRPIDGPFEEFFKAYPRRKGANPKAPARKLFDAAVKSGVDPAAITAGARRCASEDREKIGTEFIPQAVKWLRDRRWEDYQSPATTGPPQAPAGAPSDDELRKKYEQQRHAIPPETQAAGPDGSGADHCAELRREGAEIRPVIRFF